MAVLEDAFRQAQDRLDNVRRNEVSLLKGWTWQQLGHADGMIDEASELLLHIAIKSLNVCISVIERISTCENHDFL
jgi:hypothetical protein